jgi:four helix bundle protein
MNRDNKIGFEELEVWKKAREIKIEITILTKSFPQEEKFRLTDQLIRSLRSICNLIAEGQGRFTYPDQIHFCIDARGSLSETMGHLIDLFDSKYINEEQLEYYRIKLKEEERLLNGYINYLRTQRDKQSHT